MSRTERLIRKLILVLLGGCGFGHGQVLLLPSEADPMAAANLRNPPVATSTLVVKVGERIGGIEGKQIVEE